MNADQFGGVMRALFAALGGFVAAKGWIPLDTYGAVTTALVTAGTAIWSWRTNSPAK